METNQLKAFVAVAQLNSFSLAADKLHLTQPAISKRVAALENHLQQKLFDRIGKRLMLTEAGHLLLPRAQTLLQELDAIKQLVTDLSAPVQGPLALSTSHHIGLHRLPQVLRQFSKQFPQVSLDLKFVDSEKACEQVWKGEIELGVVTLPTIPWKDLRFTPIWPDPLKFVVAQDHALVSQSNISLHTLSQTPALLPSEGTFTRDIVTKVFQEVGLNFTTALNTNYMETLKSMCAIGLGWSLLPTTMIDETLTILEVPGVQLQRILGMVIHEQRTLSRAALAFTNLLEDAQFNPLG
ncbi:MAG TPA: LysR family transcriptional regulator [Gammaproteobacteria bacterium]|nr:LysR family transcriptional regulator [Gammaproteobacteria bacterium]